MVSNLNTDQLAKKDPKNPRLKDFSNNYRYR